MTSRIGAIISLEHEEPLEQLTSLGLSVCQLSSWSPDSWSAKTARAMRDELAGSGVTATAFWGGWSGPKAWNFSEGPSTLGIVPREYRSQRTTELKRAGEFAVELGVPAVVTHLGFLPENPSDPEFGPVVETVREIGRYLDSLGLEFWFETGQETPVAMVRVIRESGLTNLGVNLDPANLILYGKANPVDAVGIFGRLIRNVHAKDGRYPTDPMKLGEETRVGEGLVGFPALIEALERAGYEGPFIIEREISGEEQRRDIRATVGYLEEQLARGKG